MCCIPEKTAKWNPYTLRGCRGCCRSGGAAAPAAAAAGTMGGGLPLVSAPLASSVSIAERPQAGADDCASVSAAAGAQMLLLLQ